jgi:hypothetical protein
MSLPTSSPPPDTRCSETTTYEDVRVVIFPSGPFHYDVDVNDGAGVDCTHAVERVVVNNAEIRLEDPIWFVDSEVDVGLPVDGHGDTVWVWV